MKYVFFGTPAFAEQILKQLIANDYIPMAVVTNPDRPVGRKQIMTSGEVKNFARNSVLADKVTILQPEKLDKDFIEKLALVGADLFVVAAYGKIISQDVLSIASRGVIGVHPSLLPKYRGASPIQSALLNGEKETGVSIYFLDEKMDSGPIVKQEAMSIGESETYETLSPKLADLGAKLLLKTFSDFEKNILEAKPQDDTQATYTQKFKTEDGRVDLENDSPETIYHKIQALNPEPGVWTTQNGKRVKLLKARLESGKLVLEVTQVEGKKPSIVNSG